MKNLFRDLLTNEQVNSLFALTLPQVGEVCLCTVPADKNPQALFSPDGKERPVIIVSVDEKKGMAMVIAGSSTQNEWGFELLAGKYGLPKTTYFHSHEPREVKLSTIRRVSRHILTPEDLESLRCWRPARAS